MLVVCFASCGGSRGVATRVLKSRVSTNWLTEVRDTAFRNLVHVGVALPNLGAFGRIKSLG